MQIDTRGSLTQQQVVTILQDLDGNTSKLAREMGIHPRTVSSVKNGSRYGYVAPEMPRKARMRSCTGCQHWSPSNRCYMGIPEASEENGRYFATECNTYLPNQAVG